MLHGVCGSLHPTLSTSGNREVQGGSTFISNESMIGVGLDSAQQTGHLLQQEKPGFRPLTSCFGSVQTLHCIPSQEDGTVILKADTQELGPSPFGRCRYTPSHAEVACTYQDEETHCQRFESTAFISGRPFL